MPAPRFLLQGLRPESQLDALRWVLGCPDIQSALVAVAFVRSSGVDLLRRALASTQTAITVFAGIRNGVTSLQGLEALLAMGLRLYVVDTGTMSILYHPKVYLARGNQEGRLLLGSPNLTASGLTSNIESSLCLTLDPCDPQDTTLVTAIETTFQELRTNHPKNVHAPMVRDLHQLVRAGHLEDERDRRFAHVRQSRTIHHKDNVPRIRLVTRAIERRVAPPQRRATPGPASTYDLVWRSAPLTERDLNIPSAAGTNPTGSINLDKGLLEDGVDHRTYFRQHVFGHLNWRPGIRTVELGAVQCRLLVKGLDKGSFETDVAHTISTTSRSYIQRNAMTRLRWGPMKAHIRERDLLDRTLILLRSSQDLQQFVIEID